MHITSHFAPQFHTWALVAVSQTAAILVFVGFVLFLFYFVFRKLGGHSYSYILCYIISVSTKTMVSERILVIQLLFKVVLPHMPTQAFYNTLRRSEPTGRSPLGSRPENKSAANSKTPCWTQKSLLPSGDCLCYWDKLHCLPPFFPQKEGILSKETSSALHAPNAQCLAGLQTCPDMSASKGFC